jgi:hypothetical protein
LTVALVIDGRGGSDTRVHGDYPAIFLELIRKPFEHTELIWGIVPLYFSWAFAELTGARANFNTAVQTGFNLVWAGAHWSWQYARNPASGGRLDLSGLFAVNVLVTLITMAIGILALYSGLRRRFPRYTSFVGHSRFSSYLTITVFPIQSNYLKWSWDRLIAILIFAVPVWIGFSLLARVIRLGDSPRKRK